MSEQYENQLSAARYAFHKVVKTRYKETGQPKEIYEKAMENYDAIIANAVSGNSRKANEEDMARGFDD